ncbi:ABC transporter ATP-binding protein [Parvularcula maris]|uniref:ABC transporter ATP-binding protein/permease n=1 Tax=Parvularcula maris TaxID=2965077 RepID=A0A9X2RHJ2_9PROT|nr:ABC transporter ATP-binding protein [Parvularcula maris]MCQ8184934.1 ABC transporter ATP-binding protein/permease [Parvularcula maris]
MKKPPSYLKRLWRENLAHYKGTLGLSFLLMVGLAAAEASFVLITEWIFAGLEPGRGSRFGEVDARRVMVLGPVLIIAIALLQAGFFYAQALTAQSIGIRVMRDLQKRMFSSILRFDIAQVRGRPGEGGEPRIGGLVSRFTNDMTVLREALRRGPNGIRDIVRLVGYIAVLAFLDPVLFLCVLAIYPLIGLPISFIGQAIRRLSRRVQSQIGDLTGLLGESIAGQEVVKAYGLEAEEEKRLGQAFEERKALLLKTVRYGSASEPAVTVIASFSIAAIIAIAAFRIDAGLLTGPELVAFLIAMALLSQPARGLGTLNAILQEGLAALERVFGVIDDEPSIRSPESPEPLATEKGKAPSIRLKNITFAYDQEALLLKDFSLEVPAGSTAALVGPSGAGKSTVFGLLPRFFDPAEGQVLIGDQPHDRVSLEDLRGAIGLVGQNPFLFAATIADNIRMGRLGASDEEVRAAARSAAAAGFIEALPNGYDTRLGEGGGGLSGGERQRIALARAFLKDAPILLLDEATSALDAESERLIEEAMERLRKNRTTLVIAHRLSTIREADKIVVMERGQIVEEGTHTELLAAGGLYARLSALQTRSEPAI